MYSVPSKWERLFCLIKLLSLFSGIGAPEAAMKRIGLDFEVVGFSEINPKAVRAYCAIHNIDPGLNFGDVASINTDDLPDCDIVTWSSPCQDFSLSGKNAGSLCVCDDCGYQYNPILVPYDKRDKCPVCGSTKLSGTRSSLIIEGLRILRAKRPTISVYENVKTIQNKRHQETFQAFLKELESIGYNNYYQVLNARDFGVPQNRYRLFIVSILKEEDDGSFTFPDPFPLTETAYDRLEDDVDEKYYIDDEKAKNLISRFEDKIKKRMVGNKCLCEERYDEGLRFFKNNRCTSIRCQNAGGEKKVIVAISTSHSDDGKIVQQIEPQYSGCCNTLTTVAKDNMLLDGARIRNLTPRECWRLMDFTDEDYDKAEKAGLRRSQLYRTAGNSIVVSVLCKIFLHYYKK